MSNILITGATGNVGFEVIRFLTKMHGAHKIVAGVRNLEKAANSFKEFTNLDFVHVDFENPETFDSALNGMDRVFLLRPPHISDIEKYMKPFILKMKQKGIGQIVFLSVQGVEKSKLIPHYKIEQLIQGNGLEYIFLRPGYFMQNLTTTLIADIKARRQIILPAGNARFNWIDIQNIGEAAAILLHTFHAYKNQAFDITGLENADFGTVTAMINEAIDVPITYKKVSPLQFYRIKKREGMVKGMIIVMILLHYLPRFQKAPKISDFYERLTGKKPTDLKTFITRERKHFNPLC
jgi:uncharacterized protein YbjT (DUF2867 family)